MQVFHIFSFCLIFVGWFWCDFCCVNIFLKFSMMFRGYVNFSGIFRIVWNFLWILELIFCLEFSAQFWNRKKLKKKYIPVSCDYVEFSVYIVLIWSLIFCFNFIFRFCLGFSLFSIFCFCSSNKIKRDDAHVLCFCIWSFLVDWIFW